MNTETQEAIKIHRRCNKDTSCNPECKDCTKCSIPYEALNSKKCAKMLLYVAFYTLLMVVFCVVYLVFDICDLDLRYHLNELLNTGEGEDSNTWLYKYIVFFS